MADLAKKYGLSSGKNPFGDDENDDDVDDFTFLNYPKQGTSGYMLGSSNYSSSRQQTDDRQQQLMEELRRIEESTISSSERALGMVYESEKIGIDTAEELLHQRDQLQNTERKVDEVNKTLRTTQKHINSIKSVFGGLKNYFSKTSDSPKMESSSKVYTGPPSRLEGVVDQVRAEQPPPPAHPGLRLRGLDSPDDGADDELFLQQSTVSRSRYEQQPSARSRYQDIDNRFNENLDQMSSGLVRLKGLAIGLGDEITDQTEIIGRITDKVEDADMGVGRQNKQLKQILGK